MKSGFSLRVVWVGLLVSAIFAWPASGFAQCSEQEMTAVFVVDGIHPGTSLTLTDLMIRGTGDFSFPPDKDMIEAVAALQPNDYCNYIRLNSAGNLVQFFCEPMDTGGIGLVDERTGVVAFAGTSIWMGTGQVTCPPFSTHAWSWPGGAPAAPPSVLNVLQCPFWPDLPDYETQEAIGDNVLTYLRDTDVLKSFAACGPYTAVWYIYVPVACCGGLDEAKGVMVVQGACGPPFNNQPIPVERRAWDSLKSLYR